MLMVGGTLGLRVLLMLGWAVAATVGLVSWRRGGSARLGRLSRCGLVSAAAGAAASGFLVFVFAYAGWESGGPILYSGGGAARALTEVHVINADGAGDRRLTRPAMGALSPAWSPDGRRLAFEAGGISGDIWVVGADGSGLAMLTHSPELDVSPAWSSDGRSIAFVSHAGHGRLCVVGADGSGLTTLAESEGWDLSSPAWSPDGGKLVFTARSLGRDELFVVRADGSGMGKLTNRRSRGQASQPHPNADPAWSPDGRRIAYVKDSHTTTSGIRGINCDGTGDARLTDPGQPYTAPAFSPDGTRLAYLATQDLNTQVRIRDLASGGDTSLSGGGPGGGFAHVGGFQWSPDGKRLAVTSGLQAVTWVDLAEADGSGRRSLRRGAGSDSEPAWSPDGARIAYTHSPPAGIWSVAVLVFCGVLGPMALLFGVASFGRQRLPAAIGVALGLVPTYYLAASVALEILGFVGLMLMPR
jgi:Tol biopolymer transport system component